MVLSKRYYSVDGEMLYEKGASRVDYLPDALGSITATTVPDAPNTVENTYRMKPYGSTLGKTGTGPDPRFRWLGTIGYRRTTLFRPGIYAGARHYSQEDGRWTTSDSLWPHEKAYVYVENSPVSLVDPSGHKPQKRPPNWPKDGCWPPQKCPCWKDLPVKDNDYYMHCLRQAVDKHCSGGGVGEMIGAGVGIYSKSYLDAIIWCIVQGESSWNPNSCTEIKDSNSPQRGCLACGLMQITPSASPTCGSNWQTDPCANLECGIKNICDRLKDPDTYGWIYAQKCRQFVNAISNPWPAFDKCLKKQFGITLDHTNPATGIIYRGPKT